MVQRLKGPALGCNVSRITTRLLQCSVMPTRRKRHKKKLMRQVAAPPMNDAKKEQMPTKMPMSRGKGLTAKARRAAKA